MRRIFFYALTLLSCVNISFGRDFKTLRGHVPAITQHLTPKDVVAPTNEFRLALGLPLRDESGLEKFLEEITDPKNSKFRQYLSPEEFTARFGPTEGDYTTLKNFAKANGLTVVGEHPNRLVLDVRGSAANIERALAVKLKRFKHPTEARDFFAPDREPVVDKSLPLADVSGLDNFKLPTPKLLKKKSISTTVVPRSGSAPDGSGNFFGNDFRRAYAPDVTLTGAGQIVGLMQFDGFYPADIIAYQDAAGLPRIPVQSVLVSGYDGVPTSFGNGEVALDIELAMAMAPGISKVVIYSGGPSGFENDVLSAMVADTAVKQFSCSWGWGGGPKITTDNLCKQLAAQGQSFYNASGDDGAFTSGANSANGVDNPTVQNAPSSSPYITQVGGTFLHTSGGNYASEAVWNRNDGQTGSGGGISSYYAIPTWQTGVSMLQNNGSTTKRNIPDLAMVADDIYYIHDNGQRDGVSGTSCSAPLWAGFTALMNQQAAAAGRNSVGLINAAIYAIGKSSDYSGAFRDITVGNNTTDASPNLFYATTGYDLCTGWGTPRGQKLIDLLVGEPDTLEIFSDSNFTGSGVKGGAFGPLPQFITIQNSGDFAVQCALLNSNPATWLKIQPFKGTIPAGSSVSLALNFTASTSNLLTGTSTASVKFTNYTARSSQSFPFKFQMFAPLSVTPTKGFTANGAVRGPFDVTSQDFTIINRSSSSNFYRLSKLATWLTISPTNAGWITGNDSAAFTVALNTNAQKLPASALTASISVYNKLNQLVQSIPFSLRIGQNIVSNGGFESGDFRGWTLNANPTHTYVTNRTGYVHAGTRGALLGNTSTRGTLSQTLPTVAGQTYQISLFLDNPRNTRGATPNEFAVDWEGNTIYETADLPFTTVWSNLTFTVTAANSGSALQLEFRNDPYFLGLDDVTVKPVPSPVANTTVTSTVSVRSPVRRSVPATPRAGIQFSFNVTPGFNYQVQCTTNLEQPDWQNLGAPVTATNATLNFSDTNPPTAAQKFYRLRLAE